MPKGMFWSVKTVYFKLLLIQMVLVLAVINFAMYKTSTRRMVFNPGQNQNLYHIVSQKTSQHLQREGKKMKIQESCQKFEDKYLTSVSNTKLSEGPTYYHAPQYNLTLCIPPAKMANAVWKNIFTVMNGRFINVTSKENASKQETQLYSKQLQTLSFQDVVHNKDSLLSVVAVNPYSRLFSVYMDKVYIPTLLWNTEKRKIFYRLAKFVYPNATSVDRKKALSDKPVTFNQFLDFITSVTDSQDKLWSPLTTLYRTCETHPDFVLKVEDFSNETKSMVSSVGVEPQKVILIEKTLQQGRFSNVKELLRQFLSLRNKQKDSQLSNKEFVHRIWKLFKFQGYIHKSIGFQKSILENKKKLKFSNMLQSVHTAMRKIAMMTDKVIQQRHEELVYAYKHVTLNVLHRVKEAYFLDFKLFDYNSVVPDL